jgi:hypothetical protein
MEIPRGGAVRLSEEGRPVPFAPSIILDARNPGQGAKAAFSDQKSN